MLDMLICRHITQFIRQIAACRLFRMLALVMMGEIAVTIKNVAINATAGKAHTAERGRVADTHACCQSQRSCQLWFVPDI